MPYDYDGFHGYVPDWHDDEDAVEAYVSAQYFDDNDCWHDDGGDFDDYDILDPSDLPQGARDTEVMEGVSPKSVYGYVIHVLRRVAARYDMDMASHIGVMARGKYRGVVLKAIRTYREHYYPSRDNRKALQAFRDKPYELPF